MPKKNPVHITFGKATTTPSTRKRLPPFTAQVEMRKPHPLSPLNQYILDNEDSGLTITELTAQFQEYDCDHPQWEQVSWTPSYTEIQCTVCHKRVKKPRTNY